MRRLRATAGVLKARYVGLSSSHAGNAGDDISRNHAYSQQTCWDFEKLAWHSTHGHSARGVVLCLWYYGALPCEPTLVVNLIDKVSADDRACTVYSVCLSEVSLHAGARSFHHGQLIIHGPNISTTCLYILMYISHHSGVGIKSISLISPPPSRLES